MYIYIIKNLINKKIYIGQTNISLEDRWKRHCKKQPSFPINRAIRKYGPENFSIELLATSYSKEEADYLETYFIIIYNSQDPDIGYNITNGGEGAVGYKWSIEARRRQSERVKANPVSYWTGKQRSPETKKKISESHKGKTATPAQLIGLQKGWHVPKPKSEEHKKKLREARMKQVDPWLQHKLNQEKLPVNE